MLLAKAKAAKPFVIRVPIIPFPVLFFVICEIFPVWPQLGTVQKLEAVSSCAKRNRTYIARHIRAAEPLCHLGKRTARCPTMFQWMGK